MDSDYPLELISLKDEPRIDRSGTTIPEKVARFWLGRFGPFTERFDAATFTDALFTQRVDQLRRTIVSLHR